MLQLGVPISFSSSQAFGCMHAVFLDRHMRIVDGITYRVRNVVYKNSMKSIIDLFNRSQKMYNAMFVSAAHVWIGG